MIQDLCSLRAVSVMCHELEEVEFETFPCYDDRWTSDYSLEEMSDAKIILQDWSKV